MSDERVVTRPQGASGRPTNVELTLGDIVDGRYRLEQFLGAGGMGRVWQATDLDLRRQVAIKLMHPSLAATDNVRERFFKEARSEAMLGGPNVVQIYDLRIDASRQIPYLTMELLRGEDLSRRLARGPLSYAQTLSLLTDVCAAMTEAHARGIVHRDLKPANIFLVDGERESTAKVLDFGIVKLLHTAETDESHGSLTAAGAALGTVSYMSPEQADNPQQVDARADLWSLAVVVFECMTGKRAFRAVRVSELMREFAGPRLKPSNMADNLPAGFDEWFARATHSIIERRFQTAASLLESFAALGRAEHKPKPEQSATLPPPSRAWAADANQLDINELAALTFKNKVVNEFLDSATKYFVIGSKGLGKTLMLTYKRSLLNQQYQGDGRKQAAVKFIPEGRPYLDLMGDLPSVGKGQATMMASVSGCKRLWSFAFRVAAISHLTDRGGERGADRSSDDWDELRRFPGPLRAMLDGRKAEPTVVLKQLLSLPFGELQQLLDRSESYLEYRIRSLHSAVFMFVDKLDQALRGVGREAWVAMQAGMIESAWDLMNTNAHVKIFATIREEAFADYESDIKTNLHGATTALRYSKRDLRDMLEKLTYFYERLPLSEFLKLDIVASSTGARTEVPFEYIFRHTLGRPRDFVIIASEISRNRGALDQDAFTRIVRDASAGMLVANVFSEMRVFLDILHEREARGRFLALLTHDVLTEDELIDVWCRFHGFDREYYDLHGKNADGVYHPFRELFDCGLLGVVQRDPSTGRRHQRFRVPRDAVGGSRRQLPASSHYLLHPALQALIMQQAGGAGFRPFRHVLIGHGEPWPSYYGRLIEVQRELWRGSTRGDEDTEDGVYELLQRFDGHVAAGESVDVARRLIAATAGFTRLTKRLERTGWDELHLALLELFPSPGERSGVVPVAPEPVRLPALEPGPPPGGAVPDAVAPFSSGKWAALDSGPESTLGPTHRANVAMLLIDIVDSTNLVEQHGDTKLVDVLRGIRDRLTHDLAEPARVIKGVGDGYLVVFDTVHGALVGARTLLRTSDEPESLRLVVHCGEVHLGVADVYGAEVHRLFRLEKIGEDTRIGAPGNVTLPTPGRTLLSKAAVRELPRAEQVTLEKVGEFRLKGFEEAAEVWVERGED